MAGEIYLLMQQKVYNMKYWVVFLLIYLLSDNCLAEQESFEFDRRIILINEIIAGDNFDDFKMRGIITELKGYESRFPSEVYNALGKIYLSKTLPIRDVNKSIVYFTKSAELGFTQSNEGLGLIYSSVPDFIDYKKSYENFLISAKHGSGLAMYSIYYLYSLDAITEEEGLFWLEKSANTGLVDAIFFLADEKLEKAKENKNVADMRVILNNLESVNLEEFEGAKFYTMWRYYGNEEHGVYDFEKALTFLRLSAESRFEESIRILSEYEKLIDSETFAD
jgi:TPR repeat protein